MASKAKSIKELTKDKRNANKGSERGKELVSSSFQQYGAGRSILADKHGNIIAGNHAIEGAIEAGITEVIIVPSDGTKLVVVQRTDVDIDSKEGRGLALADNITAKENITIDLQVAAELVDEFEIDAEELGLDLSGLDSNIPRFDESDYDEDDAADNMETGDTGSGDYTENLYPLAISLNKADKLNHDKMKKICGCKTDTDLYKLLMQFAKQNDVEFSRFIDNRE